VEGPILITSSPFLPCRSGFSKIFGRSKTKAEGTDGKTDGEVLGSVKEQEKVHVRSHFCATLIRVLDSYPLLKSYYHRNPQLSLK